MGSHPKPRLCSGHIADRVVRFIRRVHSALKLKKALLCRFAGSATDPIVMTSIAVQNPTLSMRRELPEERYGVHPYLHGKQR